MRRMKLLLNSIAIALVVLLFVQFAGYLVRPLESDGPIAYINSFHNMPEGIVEVMGFGSSHMWRGLDPRIMYQEYGIAAYNYGCNWQKCNTTSLFIQDALRSQSPKVILIEAFFLHGMLLDTDVNGEIYYTKAIPEFEGKQRFLRQCFGNDLERWLSYYVPLYGFHDNWVNISQGSFSATSDGTELHPLLGFMDIREVTPVTIPDNKKVKQLEFSDQAANELEYIVQICREHDVEIVFYMTPWAGEYPFRDAMQRVAEAYGYPFINMFERIDEVGLNGDTDFSDAGHLNTSGAQKVARFLSQYLKENYDLTDMRQIPGNFWEINLQK